MDSIFVRGMRFFGYHGVFPEEQKLGQRFVVNLEMNLDLRGAGQTDKLEDTVNYGEVYQYVQEVVEGQPAALIETVAEKIADKLLGTYLVLESVVVEVEKPGAPIAGIFDTVSVRIERKRAIQG